MNQLKMTFGVEELNQLGEMFKSKRRIRHKKMQEVERAVMDEFLNPEKIEAFLTPNLNVLESINVGIYRCDWMRFQTHDEVVLIKTTTKEILQYEWFYTTESAKRCYERSKKMVHILNKIKR